MKRTAAFFHLCLTLVLFAPASLFSQTGSISGRVTDPLGNGVSGIQGLALTLRGIIEAELPRHEMHESENIGNMLEAIEPSRAEA